MTSFYGHFATAYGTCWLVLQGLATITMSRIDMGAIGFFGFPIGAAIYAWMKTSSANEVCEEQEQDQEQELEYLRKKIVWLEAQLPNLYSHEHTE